MSVDTGGDLSWCLERYPLEVSPAGRVRLQAAEATHEERQLAIVAMLVTGLRPQGERDVYRVTSKVLC